MMKKSLIKSLVLLLIIVFTSVVGGCNSSRDKQVNEFKSLDELNGKIVAVQSGCGYEELLHAKNIKADIKYFNDVTDILMAAKKGKIDAFVAEDVYANDDKLSLKPYSYFLPVNPLFFHQRKQHCFSMTGRHFPIFGMVKLLTTPE